LSPTTGSGFCQALVAERPIVLPPEQARSTTLPHPLEKQPWYRRWREATDHAIAAREARDREPMNTAAWDAAEVIFQAALTAYRLVGAEIK
jgi:hypothetical protein